jgi:NADP+-dependent farnesol dehydrogenase
MDLSRWKNRVAVVTGASAGIGASTAIELCKHGLITIGLARRVERVEKLKVNLSSDEQKNFYAMKCDVSNEKEVIQVFAEIEKKFGGVDVLINNAGIIPTTSLLDPNNSEDIHTVMNTNVMGYIYCTREATKTIKKRGVDGHVIHINSIAGHSMPFHKDLANFGIYHTSKYGVTAIAEQHRFEFIRENLNVKVTVRNKYIFFLIVIVIITYCFRSRSVPA